jgi:elongation factor P--beta-lysine ligase
MKPREIDVSNKQDVTHALEDFEAGKQAALSGKQAADNPHPTTSEEYEYWLKGYEFASKFDEDGEIPSDL